MTLNEILAPFGIELTEKELSKFELLYSTLIEWNEKMNLTAITDREEVYVKHFADSLIPLKYFEGNVCDVGAGAGFPSLPLSIVAPSLDVTMIDSVDKKVKYLNAAAGVLGVKAKALHVRAEDFAKTKREYFDVVTARAVAQTATLAEYLLPLCKVGGKVIMYKGGDVEEELKAAEKSVAVCGGKISKVEKYSFAGQSRTIVVVDKIEKTPLKYPRPQNKPRTQPIS